MSDFDDDFWAEEPEQEVTGTVELAGGNFEPLPDGTRCLMEIESIEWGYYDPNDQNVPFIDAKWTVLEPEDYANRKIFHAIKLYGDDPTGDFYDAEKQGKKIAAARAMILAIDKNAGGKIAKLKRAPTDEELQRFLIGRAMMVTVGLWEINDKSGNWVRKIEPVGSATASPKPQAKPQAKTAKPVNKQVDNGFSEDDSDGIPF